MPAKYSVSSGVPNDIIAPACNILTPAVLVSHSQHPACKTLTSVSSGVPNDTITSRTPAEETW